MDNRQKFIRPFIRWNLDDIVFSRFTAPLLIVIILTGFDLITKDIARTYWRNSAGFTVIDSICRFEFVEYYDSFFGISVSLPNEIKQPLFILGGILAMIVIFWATIHFNLSARALCGIALLCSGAIGNTGDRIFFGYVVDFFHIFYKSFQLPRFNLADVYIYIGMSILFIDSMSQFRKKRRMKSI